MTLYKRWRQMHDPAKFDLTIENAAGLVPEMFIYRPPHPDSRYGFKWINNNGGMIRE